MRRVLAFFCWKAKEWSHLAKAASEDGSHAYALRQAAVQEALFTLCTETWRDCARYLALGTGAPEGGIIKVEYTPKSVE